MSELLTVHPVVGKGHTIVIPDGLGKIVANLLRAAKFPPREYPVSVAAATKGSSSLGQDGLRVCALIDNRRVELRVQSGSDNSGARMVYVTIPRDMDNPQKVFARLKKASLSSQRERFEKENRAIFEALFRRVGDGKNFHRNNLTDEIARAVGAGGEDDLARLVSRALALDVFISYTKGQYYWRKEFRREMLDAVAEEARPATSVPDVVEKSPAVANPAESVSELERLHARWFDLEDVFIPGVVKLLEIEDAKLEEARKLDVDALKALDDAKLAEREAQIAYDDIHNSLMDLLRNRQDVASRLSDAESERAKIADSIEKLESTKREAEFFDRVVALASEYKMPMDRAMAILPAMLRTRAPEPTTDATTTEAPVADLGQSSAPADEPKKDQ